MNIAKMTLTEINTLSKEERSCLSNGFMKQFEYEQKMMKSEKHSIHARHKQ